MSVALATCVAEKDLDRLSILRFSLSSFWPGQPHYLFTENEATFSACKHYSNTYLFPQEQLTPRGEVHGWHYQQMIKLLVTSKMSEDYVLWLDCDQLLLRQYSPDLLFQDGKAKCNWTQIWEPHWMAVTELILGAKLRYQPQVSACLLSPAICQQLSEFIETKYDQDWMTYFAALHHNKVLWTEYALYFCFAKLCKLYDKYHINGNYVAPGFHLKSPAEFDFKLAWRNPSHLFSVLESNTNIPPTKALEIFNEWLLSDLWKN